MQLHVLNDLIFDVLCLTGHEVFCRFCSHVATVASEAEGIREDLAQSEMLKLAPKQLLYGGAVDLETQSK